MIEIKNRFNGEVICIGDTLREAVIRACRFKRSLFAADLRGVDLRNLDLSGIDLCSADLSDASFKNSILYDADLSFTTSTNTNWVGAIAGGCKCQWNKSRSEWIRMTMGLRFWVVTILLSPIMILLCLLAFGAAYSEGVFKWLVDRIDCAGWTFCWLHKKLAGNPVRPFKLHMRSRRW